MNHIHEFFAEAAEREHDDNKDYSAEDVARTAWVCLGGEYALRLPGAVAVKDGVPVEKAAEAVSIAAGVFESEE